MGKKITLTIIGILLTSGIIFGYFILFQGELDTNGSTPTTPALPNSTNPKQITIDFNDNQGKIKNILGSNGGVIALTSFGLWEGQANDIDPIKGYQELNIKYSRSHDFVFLMQDVVINSRGNLDDPTNYDFDILDNWVKENLKAGVTPVIMLGVGLDGRLYVAPDKRDSWSTAATNIVLHLNGKFGDNVFNVGDVKYFEIWNEPDLGEFWDGSVEEYLELYKSASQKIKASSIGNVVKVGGPVTACITNVNIKTGKRETSKCHGGLTEDFLSYVKENNLSLDFFDWHIYRGDIKDFTSISEYVNEQLIKNGFSNVENIVTEYNFCFITINQPEEFQEECKSFFDNPKATSGILSMLINFLDQGVEQAHIYSSQRSQPFAEDITYLFDSKANLQYSGYAYKAYSEMLDTPNRISTTDSNNNGYTILAGKSNNKDKINILISDYNSNNEGYKLILNNLPQGKYKYQIYAIDDSHSIPCFKDDSQSKCDLDNPKKYDLDVLESGTFTGTLEKELTAPAVHLIKLSKS